MNYPHIIVQDHLYDLRSEESVTMLLLALDKLDTLELRKACRDLVEVVPLAMEWAADQVECYD